ncbi:Pickpocket protein 28 [Eumeta japonica]|uniref:Pickpocket protein 28 n=1 Tax=Eumeta variegata TaxID=151549 RepID=A0A4C1VXD5_EUMVA|nr:Pickpocket protein 28 [Eumeta japonica]
MLIHNVWIKWQESPVIVTFSEKMIPVWQVPFPSFTICPRIKTKTFVYNFTENVLKFQNGSLYKSYNTSRFREKLDNVALVCGNDLQVRFTDRDVCDHTSVVDLIQVAPKVDDVFKKCLWRGIEENCRDIFKTVVTFHGICYNFNGLPSSDIFNEERLSSFNSWFDHPARGGQGAGWVTGGPGQILTRVYLPIRRIVPMEAIIEVFLHNAFFVDEANAYALQLRRKIKIKKSIQKEYEYMYTTRPVQGWSPDKGYELKADDDMYPRRGHQNSALPDLEIELLENVQKQDKLCIGEKRGFKANVTSGMERCALPKRCLRIQASDIQSYEIILHHPMDSPRAKPFYHIQGGQEAALSISFEMITTSENLRSYPPHIRQCYFPSERKLRYFKEYTQKNCERECRANYTFARCGCVWFNMAQALTIHEMKLSLQAAVGNETEEACRCLPACDSVKYKIAKLEVNFKDSQFSSLTRSQLFGVTDFMANCGGLLGLFLGFSFLSIVEIFYYFTLRLALAEFMKAKYWKNRSPNDPAMIQNFKDARKELLDLQEKKDEEKCQHFFSQMHRVRRSQRMKMTYEFLRSFNTQTGRKQPKRFIPISTWIHELHKVKGHRFQNFTK